MRSTLVIVPCFNEAARLRTSDFLSAIEREPSLGFVMVDDGSTDATPSILRELCSQARERIVLVTLEKNSGKAEAVRRGMLRAFELGAENAGYWDADLATPLAYIPRFAEILDRGETMMVFGSRVRLLGHRVQRSAVRHYLGRGFGTLAAFALGLAVYDTQCGAKLFKATPAVRSVFERPFSSVWSFDVEIFARLLARQAEVGDIDVEQQCMEFPLGEWVDAPGSKITFRQLPRIALELARLFTTTRSAKGAARR